VISLSQRLLPYNTEHSQQTDIHAPGGIRNRNPSKRAASELPLRPRGHSDRRLYNYAHWNCILCINHHAFPPKLLTQGI